MNMKKWDVELKKNIYSKRHWERNNISNIQGIQTEHKKRNKYYY